MVTSVAPATSSSVTAMINSPEKAASRESKVIAWTTQISLYPSSEQANRGKTSTREDRFTSRFLELTPS